jgi:cytoskeletal protein CcmA (bactofilin family)
MFGKKDTSVAQNSDARTIIGEGVTINTEGLFGTGDVKIAGVIFNDIEIDGILIVQESGTVRGDIKAINTIIEGYVEGNIVCSNVIRITASGKVVGDLRCMTLTIDEGASFSGLCEMGDRIKSNGMTYKEDQKNANWDVDKDISFPLNGTRDDDGEAKETDETDETAN